MESGELFHNAHFWEIGEYLSLKPSLGAKLVVVVTRPRRSRPPKRSQVSKAILSKKSAARSCYGCCRAFLSSGDDNRRLHSLRGAPTAHSDDVAPFARASATCAFNLIQCSDRSLCFGFHAAWARLRQYSAAHSSSDFVPSRIAASIRTNSLALRTCCVFLQAQGDFPQPIHNPFSRRALIFLPAGLRAIELPRFKSLSHLKH
jgi:hypothetical protein